MPERAQYTTYNLASEDVSPQSVTESWLDQVVQESVAVPESRGSLPRPGPNPGLVDFIAGKLSIAQSLRLWFGDVQSQVEEQGLAEWKRSSAFRLSREIAEIDSLVN